LKVFINSSCGSIKECESLKETLKEKDEENLITGEFLLTFSENKLQLKSRDKKPILCDFLDQSYLREVQQGYGRTEAIFKFLRKKEKLKILDLTAGFGRDLFKGVLCGHDMIGLERDPLVFALLQDGIRRFDESSDKETLKEKFRVDNFKVKIFNTEADTFLENINTNKDYDIIFFDEEEINKIINLGRKKTNSFILKADSSFKVDENEILSIHTGPGFKFISYR